MLLTAQRPTSLGCVKTWLEVFGYETTYEFGDDCSYFTKDIGENNKVFLEYNGQTVDSYCDYFKFRGSGYILDEYSVCVTPLYFNDYDCAIEINIKTSIIGVTKHKIRCSENTIAQYCGPQDETLYIEFKNRNDGDTYGAKFKLKITAKKEYDYNESHEYVVGAIVGGVIGGFVLIVVCIAIVCWCVCRRKSSQGRVLNPTQGFSATANPYVVYGTQTQQNMMATPSSISSPGVYPMTSYPPPQGAAYPQTNDNNLSHPPPSYDALMASSTSHVYDTV
ncbi:uncharacterized protein [Magallana gigas]|uniref:uncharacterized protein isoform X2 n=1 Tax=Magallana gigas TaxID=29159 RepID=UPI0033411FD3